MTDAALWIPRAQRPPKVYQPRARQPCVGELVQIDGSDPRWFEKRAPDTDLLQRGWLAQIYSALSWGSLPALRRAH